MVRGDLGLAPWDVLHSGFIRHVPITLGQAVILFSLLVLLLWIPLRELARARHDLERRSWSGSPPTPTLALLADARPARRSGSG